jgi:hypothetical protein
MTLPKRSDAAVKRMDSEFGESDRMRACKQMSRGTGGPIAGRFFLVALVLAVFALAPAAASAAPGLGFTEVTRVQTPVHANDERVDYEITLANTGDAVTSGTTGVVLTLPAGVRLGEGSGAGWTCKVTASLCVTDAAVTPGNAFFPLTVKLWLDPAQVPGTITATFTAFGDAVADAVAQDTFTLAPAVPFELTSLDAAACSVPPIAPDASLCGTSFGSSEYTKAGGHPYAGTASFAFSTVLLANNYGDELGAPAEDVRNLYTELPAGFIGNPQAVPAICTYDEVDEETCPGSAAVGGIDVDVTAGDITQPAPLFRIFPGTATRRRLPSIPPRWQKASPT